MNEESENKSILVEKYSNINLQHFSFGFIYFYSILFEIVYSVYKFHKKRETNKRNVQEKQHFNENISITRQNSRASIKLFLIGTVKNKGAVN